MTTTYQYSDSDNTIICVDDNGSVTYVPVDLSNSTYVEIKKLEDAGTITITAYSAPTPTWDGIRSERNSKLLKTDWVMVSDGQISTASKTSFTTYRQDLRDIPQDYATPADVVWPQEPAYEKTA